MSTHGRKNERVYESAACNVAYAWWMTCVGDFLRVNCESFEVPCIIDARNVFRKPSAPRCGTRVFGSSCVSIFAEFRGGALRNCRNISFPKVLEIKLRVADGSLNLSMHKCVCSICVGDCQKVEHSRAYRIFSETKLLKLTEKLYSIALLAISKEIYVFAKKNYNLIWKIEQCWKCSTCFEPVLKF